MLDLKKMREKVGLTQAEIALRLTVSPAAYAKMERNEMPIPHAHISELAKAFKIPVTKLVKLIADAFIEELLLNIEAIPPVKRK